jgi:hypothetical protein
MLVIKQIKKTNLTKEAKSNEKQNQDLFMYK